MSEALFLSEKEKTVIASLFDSIAAELNNNIDTFSQDVLVSQIELLLNHSSRFYNRQFLTRKAVHHDVISQIDTYLADHFQNYLNKLPTVQRVSEHFKVAPRYLTDMLQSLTGQSTQQYTHYKLIEKAKERLSTTSLSVSEIAYELEFEHLQSFSKLFKAKTNFSPFEFRASFN